MRLDKSVQSTIGWLQSQNGSPEISRRCGAYAFFGSAK